MKTLKTFVQESILFYQEHPECFKHSYSKRMGGTQTVVIEGLGEYYFDDRDYYSGRGKKYNNDFIHEHLGNIQVTKAEFDERVQTRAKSLYNMQKSRIQAAREYRKSYNQAAEKIGRERLDEGLELVKSFTDKTYLFIDNVMLYKAYKSEHVPIEIVSDEYRNGFNWDEWYSAPYAADLGMTPDNKNLFIC